MMPLSLREWAPVALVEIRREDFMEAQEAVARNLSIDPKHGELLEFRQLIAQAKKPGRAQHRCS
jgi:hypothetical protein